jgi:hypothetical protein
MKGRPVTAVLAMLFVLAVSAAAFAADPKYTKSSVFGPKITDGVTDEFLQMVRDVPASFERSFRAVPAPEGSVPARFAASPARLVSSIARIPLTAMPRIMAAKDLSSVVMVRTYRAKPASTPAGGEKRGMTGLGAGSFPHRIQKRSMTARRRTGMARWTGL